MASSVQYSRNEGLKYTIRGTTEARRRSGEDKEPVEALEREKVYSLTLS